ncbi:MAG TPA: hypothetical protein VI451_04690 [Anaerolineales bacterium]|nr:hypothetical protein [Anaerolineales bacterium]
MNTKAPSRPHKQVQGTGSSQRNFLWVGVGVAALIFIVAAVIIWQQTIFPFSFVGGDEHSVVLLRNPYTSEYQLKFTGDEPANLKRVIIQLESPQRVLHVDVEGVVAIVGGQEVALDTSGYMPEGSQLTIQPDETFTVQVTYYGQTIGAHYVYGFRLGYETNGSYKEDTLKIKDREFTVSVE